MIIIIIIIIIITFFTRVNPFTIYIFTIYIHCLHFLIIITVQTSVTEREKHTNKHKTKDKNN